MTPAEYLHTQNTLGMLAQLVVRLDLAGFLQAISTAEAVGPVLDPTLYRDAREKLGQVERLARAALAFRAEAERQMKAAGLEVAS